MNKHKLEEYPRLTYGKIFYSKMSVRQEIQLQKLLKVGLHLQKIIFRVQEFLKVWTHTPPIF